MEHYKQLALAENLTLTTEHIMVIKLLKRFYQEFSLIPSTKAIINYAKRIEPTLQLDSLLFAKLFPNGIAQACKIAKLPPSPRCL